MCNIDKTINTFETKCKTKDNNCDNRKCSENVVDCLIPFNLILAAIGVTGNVTSLQSINFNGLVATISGNVLNITGNIIATFIINGVAHDVTFPVNYFEYNITNCSNTINPIINIRNYSFNIVNGTIVFVINGTVLTTHLEIKAC